VTNYEQFRALGLSLQRALLGAISANVYAVGAAIVESKIVISAVYYLPPSEDEQEDFSVVASEVISDFSAPYTIDTEWYVMPESEPNTLDFWAFMRKEKG